MTALARSARSRMLRASRPRRLARRAIASALLAALANACGGDAATAPAAKADLGQAFAALGLPLLIAAGAYPGVFVPPVTEGSTGCGYAAARQSFVCIDTVIGSNAVAFSYRLFDAVSAPQTAFDPARTSSMRTTTSLRVTSVQGGLPVTTDGSQEMLLTGMLTDTYALNGSSSFHLTGYVSIQGRAEPIDARIDARIVNLVLPAATATTSWPKSGTITSEGYSGSQTTPDGRTVMTFDGTSKVAVTITNAAGARTTCTIDLTIRDAITICRE